MSFRLASCRLALVSLLLALAGPAFAYAQNTPVTASQGMAPAKPGTAAAPAAATPVSGLAAAPMSPPAIPASPGNAARGQARGITCIACHGPDGNALIPANPSLAGQHELYIAQQLADFKSGARRNPIMQAMTLTLTPQDMRDIGAYFASKTIRPGASADSALLASGQTLYREGDRARGIPACMACHGIDGRGNPAAMYPQLRDQHAIYVAAKLKDFHDGVSFGDTAHAQIMPLVAKALSEQDITALSAYIQAMPASP